jgi:hypothetical protein
VFRCLLVRICRVYIRPVGLILGLGVACDWARQEVPRLGWRKARLCRQSLGLTLLVQDFEMLSRTRWTANLGRVNGAESMTDTQLTMNLL